MAKKKSLWDNSSLQGDVKWDNQPLLEGQEDSEVMTARWQHSDSVRRANLRYKDRLQNPQWYDRTREKNQQLAQQPEWRHKVTETNQRRAYEGSDWHTKTVQGAERRRTRGQELLEQGLQQEYRLLFGVKDQHTEQTKKQMSASARSRWAKTMRRVNTDQGVFVSIYEAAEALRIHKDTVAYRIKSQKAQWSQWYYIEDEVEES